MQDETDASDCSTNVTTAHINGNASYTFSNLLIDSWSTLCSSLVFRVKRYTSDTVEHVIILCIAYTALSVFLYVSIVRLKLLSFRKAIPSARRVLFVTAHPDDECMFFGPTILNLIKNGNCTIYLLCLSTGVNYGMGKTRKKELYNACNVLGIREGNIIIHNHTNMPDCIKTPWPTELVAKVVLNQIEQYSIDTVITFDKYGVSRHPNHCSIYYAIAYLFVETTLPIGCKVYLLETINVLRKYWSILDIPVCYILSQFRYMLSCKEKLVIYKAMKQHRSQLLWFRYLYLLFSRYLVINTLEEMSLMDIELDVDD